MAYFQYYCESGNRLIDDKERIGGDRCDLSPLIRLEDMDSFMHDVLGDVSDETRWLKFLPSPDLLRLAGTGLSCIFAWNIFPKTGFFIFIEVGVMLAMLVRVVLGLVKKSKRKYLKGGGVDYYRLIKRKRHFKKSVKEYSLGTEGKYDECR